METANILNFWPLIHSVLREIWHITEPQIEECAVRNNIPIELYYYAEFGLKYFSVEEFQGRDPFTNPEQFEKQFARLQVKDWITSTGNGGRYQVTDKSREAARQIIEAGDEYLRTFEAVRSVDLERLLAFLKQILVANHSAAVPPEKRATLRRFRVATPKSPLIVQVRECLMDIFAYHDDAHLSAARPEFNLAGIVWSAFGSVCHGNANTAQKIAEAMSSRGYEVSDYAAALRAATEVGWLEETETQGVFKPTANGKEMHDRVQKLTNKYFYRPWAMFSQNDLDELYALLMQLREQLRDFKKNS